MPVSSRWRIGAIASVKATSTAEADGRRYASPHDQAFLTIKGPSMDGGLSRYEFEKEITLDEADHLFQLCEAGIIDKRRYLVDYEGHTFEVDEFYGDNEGLVMAEVELKSTEEDAKIPDFIGIEVTGDRRFYNSRLRLFPYKMWKDAT